MPISTPNIPFISSWLASDCRKSSANSSMAFPNHYTHRKVAETSARTCEICFKPSTSVLITPDNKVSLHVTSLPVGVTF